MLPDFPQLKAQALRVAIRRIGELEKQHHPVLERIRAYTQHEGQTADYEQVGYGRKTVDYQSLSVKCNLTLDEIPDLVGVRLDQKLSDLANEIGGEKVKRLLAKVQDATAQTGKVVDGGGSPPSGSLLLDAMEVVEESFDDSGKSKLSWLVHPSMLPAMQKASEEVENDPELRARRQRIATEQRSRWFARENCRKLVD